MSWNTFSKETKRQAEAFNKIGKKYETVFGQNQNQIAAIEWLINQLPQQAHVLDVGCGTGEPTARLITEAGHQVLGIDASPKMLDIAVEQAPLANFELMDMVDLNLPGQQFDAITAFFSLLMLPKETIAKVLRKLVSVLKPQGYFVLAMVEGDLDYVEIPFIESNISVSAYFEDELTRLLGEANLTVLQVKRADFSASAEAPPESQLFYYCHLNP
jgi:ubiquinone/menaquinone biosynthesis C-methylase UbiE